MPRGQSNSFSPNKSKELSVYSDISFMAYVDKIQVLANNSMWAEQVESEKIQSPFLSYTILKERMNNSMSMEPTVEPMHISHIVEINDTSTPQGLESLVNPYTINQPTDS